MTPILDIQRRLHEVGRIRIGRQVEITGGRNVGKKRPERLDRFRLTSSSQRALEAVAAVYGGKVEAWKDAPVGEQWELMTDAMELQVIVPPQEMSFTQSYELWSAGGCQRRCDGAHESISDAPCLCDPDDRDCKPHTRLSVMLVGIAGVGLWRLDTQGWYAAGELQGAYGLAQLLGESLGRSILPGRLRVEARTVKRPDPRDASKVITRNFVVPILDFDVDVAAVALNGLPTREGIGSNGITPIPAIAAPSVADQLADVDKQEPTRRRNSPPSLPRTGVQPRTVDAVQGGQSHESTPPQQAPETAAQRSQPAQPASSDQSPGLRRLLSLMRVCGFGARDDRLAISSLVVGRAIASSKDMTEAEVIAVGDALEEHRSGKAHIFKKADGAWKVDRPAGVAQRAEQPAHQPDDAGSTPASRSTTAQTELPS